MIEISFWEHVIIFLGLGFMVGSLLGLELRYLVIIGILMGIAGSFIFKIK